MSASSGSVLLCLSAAGINAQTEANFRRKERVDFISSLRGANEGIQDRGLEADTEAGPQRKAAYWFAS